MRVFLKGARLHQARHNQFVVQSIVLPQVSAASVRYGQNDVVKSHADFVVGFLKPVAPPTICPRGYLLPLPE